MRARLDLISTKIRRGIKTSRNNSSSSDRQPKVLLLPSTSQWISRVNLQNKTAIKFCFISQMDQKIPQKSKIDLQSRIFLKTHITRQEVLKTITGVFKRINSTIAASFLPTKDNQSSL